MKTNEKKNTFSIASLLFLLFTEKKKKKIGLLNYNNLSKINEQDKIKSEIKSK